MSSSAPAPKPLLGHQTFPQFQRLPVEIQQHIWKLAYYRHRGAMHFFTVLMDVSSPNPVWLQALPQYRDSSVWRERKQLEFLDTPYEPDDPRYQHWPSTLQGVLRRGMTTPLEMQLGCPNPQSNDQKTFQDVTIDAEHDLLVLTCSINRFRGQSPIGSLASYGSTYFSHLSPVKHLAVTRPLTSCDSTFPTAMLFNSIFGCYCGGAYFHGDNIKFCSVEAASVLNFFGNLETFHLIVKPIGRLAETVGNRINHYISSARKLGDSFISGAVFQDSQRTYFELLPDRAFPLQDCPILSEL